MISGFTVGDIMLLAYVMIAFFILFGFIGLFLSLRKVKNIHKYIYRGDRK